VVGKGRFKGGGTVNGFEGCLCDLESEEEERAEGAEAGGGGRACDRGGVAEPR
jgi:hypothetical protein